MNTTTTRAELLALRPERYLQGGYRDAQGRARPELNTLWAMAAAEQLLAAGVSAAALEGLIHDATQVPARGSVGAPAAATALVEQCAAAVHAEADRGPFRQHLAAVLRLLALAESTASFNTSGVPPRRP